MPQLWRFMWGAFCHRPLCVCMMLYPFVKLSLLRQSMAAKLTCCDVLTLAFSIGLHCLQSAATSCTVLPYVLNSVWRNVIMATPHWRTAYAPQLASCTALPCVFDSEWRNASMASPPEHDTHSERKPLTGRRRSDSIGNARSQ